MNAGYRDILKILGTYGKAKQSDCMAQREQFQTNCRNLSWKSVLMEQVGDKKRFRTNRNKMWSKLFLSHLFFIIMVPWVYNTIREMSTLSEQVRLVFRI